MAEASGVVPGRTLNPGRTLMWLLVVVAGYWLVTGLRSVREGVEGGLARGLALATLCLLMAGVLGIRLARNRASARAADARVAARILVMAQLGQQDDATLERIAASAGPAADAARLILQGRHLGNPAGSPRHSRPEQ